jgi:propionyl-CoA carboxylase alpha chain
LDGKSPSNQSYLLGDKIIEVVKLGWMLFIPVWVLSENADFAETEQNNIILLGLSQKPYNGE